MQLVIFYFLRLLQSGFSLRGRVAERRLAETLPDGEDQGNMDPEDEHSIRDALDGYYRRGKRGAYLNMAAVAPWNCTTNCYHLRAFTTD